MATAARDPQTCSVARTLDVIGEKWAILALREVFLGCRRFEEIVRNTGAPRDTLAARLRTLVDQGVLVRRRYSEHPPRDEYVLTDAGRDLYPVLLSLLQWGDRHRPLESGPSLVLDHDCGHRLEHRWDCVHCGREIDVHDVTRVAPARV